MDDLTRAEARFFEAPENDHPLRLISRRQLRSNNSWMHNSHRLVKGKPRCTAQIHPDDAAAAGLVAGDSVRVTSAVGSIELPIEITDDIAQGVVSIPHGWGHDREGVELDVARAHAGTSINDITDDALIEPVTGTAILSGVPISIAPVS